MNELFRAIQDFQHVRYISHRGFQPLAPENSLPSFSYAAKLGQWAVETDVRFTKDGVAVCCHDSTTDRMFNDCGVIREMTWQEISRLSISHGNRLFCFPGEQLRMPKFSEYLAICKKHGSIPFIELKTEEVSPVLEEVRKAGFGEQEVIFSSTNLDLLADSRKKAPHLFIHWIFAREEELPRLASLGNAGLSWNEPDPEKCDERRIRAAHEQGLYVCLRAGDTLAQVQYMLRLGLDYIPSNQMHNG